MTSVNRIFNVLDDLREGIQSKFSGLFPKSNALSSQESAIRHVEHLVSLGQASCFGSASLDNDDSDFMKVSIGPNENDRNKVVLGVDRQENTLNISTSGSLFVFTIKNHGPKSNLLNEPIYLGIHSQDPVEGKYSVAKLSCDQVDQVLIFNPTAFNALIKTFIESSIANSSKDFKEFINRAYLLIAKLADAEGAIDLNSSRVELRTYMNLILVSQGLRDPEGNLDIDQMANHLAESHDPKNVEEMAIACIPLSRTI